MREPSSSEAELLGKWQAGDRVAGETLLQAHRGLLYRFFANKVSRDVEDLVQETLVAAASTSERFEGRCSFRSYLLSIARHRLFEHYRKRRLEARHFEFDTVSAVDLSPSPSVHAAQQGEQRLLLEALRGIPVSYQIVLELHYWEDLSGPEVADALAVPLDTAYSRLRKAKSLLKKKLEVLAASKEALASTVDRLDLWAGGIREQLVEPRESQS